MRLKIATGVLFTTAIFFAGCAKKGPPLFEADEFKQDKLAVAQRYVKIEHPKALKKQSKKAFVPLFQVEFVNQSNASSSSVVFGDGNSSNLHVSYHLEGVDTASFVSLVDGLYSDFLGQLKSSGYEVISKEDMVKTPQYQELIGKAEKSNPLEVSSRLEGSNKALVVAPPGMAVFYINSFNPKPSIKGFFAAFKGDLPEAPLARLTDSTQAVAVCVQMIVSFADLKDDHIRGSGTSSISTTYRFAVANMHTLIGFGGEESVSKSGNPNRWNFRPNEGTVARIIKPIYGGSGFVTGKRDITSTGTKVAEGVANAFSMLAAASSGGSSTTSKTRIYALDVDKDKYIALAHDNIGYANDMLMTVINAAK